MVDEIHQFANRLAKKIRTKKLIIWRGNNSPS